MLQKTRKTWGLKKIMVYKIPPGGGGKPILASGLKGILQYQPRHDKTCFCHIRTTKAQISLRIRAVWSAPLLFAA